MDVSTLRINRNDVDKTTREDNVQVITDKVYECLFENGKWIPYRARFDKEFPNRTDVAYHTWSLINNDVKSDYLSSLENASAHSVKLSEEDAGYFVMDATQKRQRTIMNEVHMKMKLALYLVAKHYVYRTDPKRKQVFLYETACGKFGDLHNWNRAGVTDVFVSDIDYTSLREGRRRLDDSGYRIVLRGYATVDLTKPIDNVNAIVSKNVPMVEQDKMRQSLKTYFIDEEPQFDISSCQFALHYFCKDKETFLQYIYNATLKLKTGGVFIATIMDGKRVFDTMKGKQSINGYMKSSDGENVAVWNIEKVSRQEGDWIKLKDFGQEINVTINTIGKTHNEYLVNVDAIKQLLSLNKLQLIQQIPFLSHTPKFYGSGYESLKQFSDLHVMLVFKKLN